MNDRTGAHGALAHLRPTVSNKERNHTKKTKKKNQETGIEMKNVSTDCVQVKVTG